MITARSGVQTLEIFLFHTRDVSIPNQSITRPFFAASSETYAVHIQVLVYFTNLANSFILLNWVIRMFITRCGKTPSRLSPIFHHGRGGNLTLSHTLHPQYWYHTIGTKLHARFETYSNIYTNAARAIAPPSIAAIGALVIAAPVAAVGRG